MGDEGSAPVCRIGGAPPREVSANAQAYWIVGGCWYHSAAIVGYDAQLGFSLGCGRNLDGASSGRELQGHLLARVRPRKCFQQREVKRVGSPLRRGSSEDSAYSVRDHRKGEQQFALELPKCWVEARDVGMRTAAFMQRQSESMESGNPNWDTKRWVR